MKVKQNTISKLDQIALKYFHFSLVMVSYIFHHAFDGIHFR